MKCLSLFIFLIIVFAFFISPIYNIKKNKQRDVKWKGWVKFTHFFENLNNVNNHNNQTSFFENQNFFNQNLKTNLITSNNNIIPSNQHFYAMLYKDRIIFNLDILNLNYLHKKDKNNQIFDKLILDTISPLDFSNSGIKLLNNYNQGSCVEIFTSNLNNIKQNWIICLDDKIKRDSFLKALIKIKLEKNNSNFKTVSESFNQLMNTDHNSVEYKTNKIENELKNEDEEEIKEKMITAAKQEAMREISKEEKIEKKIQEDIKMKTNFEADELIIKKIKEEKKARVFLQIMKEKEIEQMNTNKNAEFDIKTQLQLENIKVNTKMMIEKRRQELRQKILDIKKRAENRKKVIEYDIELIKQKMKENNIRKKTEIKLCIQSSLSNATITNYCDNIFLNDVLKNTNCKIDDNFCHICCENEINSSFPINRGECYNVCDKIQFIRKNKLNKK